MRARRGSQAIVIGAGMAGLVTARVLSDHFDQVTILERDRLPEEAVARRGVPQGRHAHLLLATGQDMLIDWFPGLDDDLVGAGAVPFDAGDVVWHQDGAYWVKPELGRTGLSMSQPLLEHTVRERLLSQRPNVSIADQVAVDGLILAGGRVIGVRCDGVEHRADLVVGCTGRNTRFLDHLAKMGYPAPKVSAVRTDMVYETRLVRRRPSEIDGAFALIADDPTRGHRIVTMLPVEGDRWMITVATFHDDVPATDPDEFVGTLPSPALADILARSEALTPVLTYRMSTSQRRHVERMRRNPPGFVVLGDAVCSLNPIYGQGMSSAALQADALGRAIERHGPTASALPCAFYRRAGEAVDAPWRISATVDFADPRTSGARPLGTGLLNRYLAEVFQACHTSVPVARRLLQVQNLLARPLSLITPAMVARVLLGAHRSRAAGRHGRQPMEPLSAGDVGRPRGPRR